MTAQFVETGTHGLDQPGVLDDPRFLRVGRDVIERVVLRARELVALQQMMFP